MPLKFMQTYVLGIDVGTGGTRALIMGGDGRVLVSATAEHEPLLRPSPDGPNSARKIGGEPRESQFTKHSPRGSCEESRFLALGFLDKCTGR